VIITPFHNMLLCSPATTEADVQRLLMAFDDVLAELVMGRVPTEGVAA
jgi:glutamate-1-semialdehyde 2,1-aminomutase